MAAPVVGARGAAPFLVLIAVADVAAVVVVLVAAAVDIVEPDIVEVVVAVVVASVAAVAGVKIVPHGDVVDHYLPQHSHQFDLQTHFHLLLLLLRHLPPRPLIHQYYHHSHREAGQMYPWWKLRGFLESLL